MNATGLERVRTGNLLDTDEVGHDACGIGGIAARDGKPSAELLRKAVGALRAMEHRGGVCGDAGPQCATLVRPEPLRHDGGRKAGPRAEEPHLDRV